MFDVLGIGRGEIAFGHRQIMNRVKQISFTTAIHTRKTIHRRNQIQRRILIIFEI